MHTTIIYESANDSALSSSINAQLNRQFTDPDISLLELNKDKIAPCVGCFGCWLKTPGKCVVQTDVAAKTAPAFVQSDYVIIVTSIHYGCYSATTKRMLDRIIPIILPFFTKYKNEMHHQKRYKHLAKQIILAYSEDITPAEKDTFLSLTRANATNLMVSDPEVFFCQKPDDIQSILNTIKKQVTA